MRLTTTFPTLPPGKLKVGFFILSTNSFAKILVMLIWCFGFWGLFFVVGGSFGWFLNICFTLLCFLIWTQTQSFTCTSCWQQFWRAGTRSRHDILALVSPVTYTTATPPPSHFPVNKEPFQSPGSSQSMNLSVFQDHPSKGMHTLAAVSNYSLTDFLVFSVITFQLKLFKIEIPKRSTWKVSKWTLILSR